MHPARFAIALLLATPSAALAQLGAVQSTVPNSTLPSATTDALPSSMTCQQMMDRARARFDSRSPGAAKTYARSESYLADRAMESGHDDVCKAHMQKVIRDLR
jgi:hypothetical protein